MRAYALAAVILMIATLFNPAQSLAQEQESKKAENAEKKGAEPVERPTSRRRLGPNMGKATFGGAEVSLMAGHLASDGVDALAIDAVKKGDVIRMTEGVALKLKTAANLQFGDLAVKTENVAPNYPGVYSIWFKKTADGWTASFNEKADVWGTMYQPDHDIGSVPAAYSKLDEPVEKLTLKVTKDSDDKGALQVDWAQHRWTLPFTVTD